MTEAISNSTFKSCINCGTLIDVDSKFCAFCGMDQIKVENKVLAENTSMVKGACPACGEKFDRDVKFCPACGREYVAPVVVVVKEVPIVEPAKAVQAPVPGAVTPQQEKLPPNYVYNSKGKKIHRITAGVLSLLLGSVGAHWYYIGKPALGVLSVLTCWTGIPALVGFIHGIIYLTSSDEDFRMKYLP